MRQIRSLTLCLWLLLSVSSALADPYAGSFLKIGVGARALGLGGAFVSLADDGTAAYWNPAGLAQLKTRQITVTHAFLFKSLANHDFFNITMPLDNGMTIGMSWIRLSVDDIPRFSALVIGQQGSGIPNSYFSDAENAYLFSFAKMYRLNPSPGWEYGPIPIEVPIAATFKYIHQSLGNGASNGIGLDLGAMMRMSLSDIFGAESAGHASVGISARDVTGTRIRWNTKRRETISPSVRLATSYTQPIRRLNGTLVVALQGSLYNAGARHSGAEYWYRNVVAFRIGSEDRFTMGMGMVLWRVMLDYAFLNQDLGGTHRVSGSFNF